MIATVSSLLLGISILLVGSGLLGTLLGVRASLETFQASVIGLIMSAYFLGFIAGTFLCTPLIRRVGHIRSFTAMAAVAASSAFAHTLYVQPLWWAALRTLNGICLVGLYMVVESWLNERAPRKSRGRVFAAYVTATLAAGALGQALVLVDGFAGALGFGLAATFLTLGLVPVAVTDLAEPALTSAPKTSLGRLYGISPLGLVGSLAAGLANSAFWGMGAVFAHRIGMSPAGIAGFMGATILGGAILQWPVGHLSDRFDRRAVLTVVCFASMGAAAAALLAVPVSHGAVIAVSFVYGGMAFTVYGLSVAHMNDHLPPGEVLEATRGLLLVYGAGATLGPTVAGLLMTGLGPGTLLAYFATVYGLLGLYALRRTRVSPPVPPEEQRAYVPLARVSPEALGLYPEAAGPTRNAPARQGT